MQVLSLDQAAYKAGIVRRTLERLLADGLGPAKVQLSKRRVGILDSDLDRWLASRRVPQPGTESTYRNTPAVARQALRDQRVIRVWRRRGNS